MSTCSVVYPQSTLNWTFMPAIDTSPINLQPPTPNIFLLYPLEATLTASTYAWNNKSTMARNMAGSSDSFVRLTPNRIGGQNPPPSAAPPIQGLFSPNDAMRSAICRAITSAIASSRRPNNVDTLYDLEKSITESSTVTEYREAILPLSWQRTSNIRSAKSWTVMSV